MLSFLHQVALESWWLLNAAAPYVLFGFVMAGVLKALIPESLVARHLGGPGFSPVMKASLFGIPLPLCSCGVIPVAIGLRRQGASKGATASFLVSVPETGVDSVAITWALLDPLMTVLRPVAAFVTALFTGTLINLLPETASPSQEAVKPACGCESAQPAAQTPLGKRLRSGLIYALTDLLRDIGGWLLLGIGIAGLITTLVPVDFVESYLTGEFSALLLMLVIGIPLYICASASTPIAAALVLKGLSPGAALVFLLAGPATNTATMTVVARHLGKAATAIYVAAIAFASLGLGWLVNRLYAWLEIDISRWADHAESATDSELHLISTLILLALLVYNAWPRRRSGDCCPL
ncbi:MAG: SO_0444 family Cu/Zn efflux transporter [Desulfuromonadales bacterium]|nr:SO_0444 family Cu/Zn efflux transporter [Desulfuromonadales bacterium]